MASANISLDGAELFNECLAQATVVVKQVLPAHYANATPNTEMDVKELVNHMIGVLESVGIILGHQAVPLLDDLLSDDSIDQEALDLSVQWQSLADRAEAMVNEADLEDTVMYDKELTAIENVLIELSGNLLIHTWDLGEAIGMSVKFERDVAEAIMVTTIVPSKSMLNTHNLFNEPIDPPANADLQTRLLALFGRSYAWRTFS